MTFIFCLIILFLILSFLEIRAERRQKSISVEFSFATVFAFKHRRIIKLNPHSRVLRQKLTGSQLVKKFPAFYGTRRFITAFTNARHLSLS